MTPLELRISLGEEDARLLDIISHMEHPLFRVSERQKATLRVAYERLDFITRPDRH